MKLTSIHTRLLLALLPFFILAFVALSGISYYLSQQSLSRSVNETAMAVGTDYANRIQADMQIMITQLEDLASTQIIRSGDKSQVGPATMEALSRLTKFENFLFIAADGSGFRSDATTAKFKDSECFKAVVATKKPYISNPLVARSTGKISVVLAVPVIQNGNLIGVLAANYSLAEMSGLIKDLRFEDTGYGALIDHSGLLLAHPRMPELVGKLNYAEKKINPELKLKQTELDDRLLALFKKVTDTGKTRWGQVYLRGWGGTDGCIYTG